MKVLFADTTNHLGPIGGGHLYLPELLKKLEGRGIETHLVTAGTPHHLLTQPLKESGVRIHIKPWQVEGILEDKIEPCAQWINELRPDVLLISNSADVVWAALPHLDPAIGTSMTAHSDLETYYAPVRHYRSMLTGVIGVSEEICGSFVQSCGFDPQRVRWIPYGVDSLEESPSTDPSGDEIRIVYVGRLTEPHKRISDVVKLALELELQNVPFSLEIVGDGDRSEFVSESLRSLVDQGTVRLSGWVDPSGVESALRRAELFILTSDSEGFCISLVEAMANGCCPIVTNIRSGNKKLVTNGENGYLVEVGDITSFVDKIKTLHSRRDLLDSLRKKAWSVGKGFDRDSMAEKYEDFFIQVQKDCAANPRAKDPDFPLMESCKSPYPLWVRRMKARLKRTMAI